MHLGERNIAIHHGIVEVVFCVWFEFKVVV